MACDVVRWGRVEIPYAYVRTRRKTLAISVHPDLTVTVRAPEDAPLEVIREKVWQRGAWIRKCWREFELYLPKQPPRRYISGKTHRYLGRQYRLRVERGAKESAKCLRGYLHVTTREEPTPETTRALLEAWYRRHAHRVFHERLEGCCKRASVEGIGRPPITIRKMRTR